jgi:hypothetical protein
MTEGKPAGRRSAGGWVGGRDRSGCFERLSSVVSSRSRFAQPESPFLDSAHRRARRRGAGPRDRDMSAGVGSCTRAGSARPRTAAVDGHVLRSCRLDRAVDAVRPRGSARADRRLRSRGQRFRGVLVYFG